MVLDVNLGRVFFIGILCRMSALSGNVLVLNLDYQPINICGARRAVKMIYLGKAEILEDRGEFFKSTDTIIPQPSVIKLSYLIRRPQPELKLSRKAIFARDHYQCQYCGRTGIKMTIDHVMPRRQGGIFSWDNLVCACHACNAKKGDRMPVDAGMKLLKQPARPSFIPHVSYTLYRQSMGEENWRKYLPRKLYG
jgi:5-methylcytosine-specific restriction endonuclease McrA